MRDKATLPHRDHEAMVHVVRGTLTSKFVTLDMKRKPGRVGPVRQSFPVFVHVWTTYASIGRLFNVSNDQRSQTRGYEQTSAQRPSVSPYADHAA